MIRNIIFIGIAAYATLCSSCNPKDDDKTFSTNHIEGVDSLRRQIIMHGDTIAYGSLRIYFLESNQTEQLGFSLLMANKYKYSPAYLDVVNDLKEWNQVDLNTDSVNLTSVDRATRVMILKYLILADKNNYVDASYELEWLKATNLYTMDILEAERQVKDW